MGPVLGIETSCDETAAAVVLSDGRVLSDVVHSQIALHAPYGGVIPELASRDHLRNLPLVVAKALERAELTIDAVDAVAVTHRPGLVGALLVGVQLAKGLAWASGKPLVGVDHLIGHLFAIHLQRGPDPGERPEIPFVALLVSGGHTAIYRVDGPLPSQIHELGGTRDDAAGEAFDKVAKLLGLGYPGGPAVDRLASAGDASRHPFTLPMARSRNFEFSFSGIKTQVAQHVAEHGAPAEPQALADLCASFQSAVTSVLARKLVAAAEQEGVRDVVLGGGVAANRELRARVSQLSQARGLRAHLPELASCTDNAAMIAYAGALAHGAGARDGWDLLATSVTSLARVTRKGRGSR